MGETDNKRGVFYSSFFEGVLVGMRHPYFFVFCLGVGGRRQVRKILKKGRGGGGVEIQKVDKHLPLPQD